MPDDDAPEPRPDSAYPPPSSAYPPGDNPPPAAPPGNQYGTPGQMPPGPYGASTPPGDPYHPGQPGSTPAGGNPGPQAWPPPPVGSYAPAATPQYSPVNATMILILGILGLTICGICAPIAWVLGNQAMATLNQYGDPLSQRGLVNGGRICGIIGSALVAIGILFYVIALAFGFLGALTHPSSS